MMLEKSEVTDSVHTYYFCSFVRFLFSRSRSMPLAACGPASAFGAIRDKDR